MMIRNCTCRDIVALLLVVAFAVPGHAQESYEEGFAAYERGDYATAFKIMKTFAEQGSAAAQYELGHIYWSGTGVPQSYGEALKWFLKAAQQGHAETQRLLGLRYQIGWGVEQDFGEAAKWNRKAARQGKAEAQAALGSQYYRGQGVPQSYSEAAKWFRKAAKQGDGFAQNRLGIMYQNGQGMAQNYEKAVTWYRKAAEQNVAEAQAALGLMYGTGHGVPQDDVQAYTWLSLAASNQKLGEVRNMMVSNRDIIERRMTPAQVIEAQRLAREWKSHSPTGRAHLIKRISPRSSNASGIMKLQILLGALDYSPGSADGILGPKTHAAVTEFLMNMEKKGEEFHSSEKATLELIRDLGLR